MIKITIDYNFMNINKYVGQCRANYHLANKTKQAETKLSAMYFSKIPKIDKFPIQLTFYWHMKSKIADLDGRLPKNIIDGLVYAKKIPDDNVKYINKITHIYIEDKKDYLEMEIDYEA